jgi:hypothetical protein
MSWGIPDKNLKAGQVRYQHRIFEWDAYYKWRNAKYVSKIININGAVITHRLYNLEGTYLKTVTNTMQFFYENTGERVKPKVC